MSKKRKAVEIFPPSEFIQEEMEARGWSVTTLAEKTQLDRAAIESLLANKRKVTRLVAFGLSNAFDTSPDIWMNLQQSYDEREV